MSLPPALARRGRRRVSGLVRPDAAVVETCLSARLVEEAMLRAVAKGEAISGEASG
jgi:hypothetical protein